MVFLWMNCLCWRPWFSSFSKYILHCHFYYCVKASLSMLFWEWCADDVNYERLHMEGWRELFLRKKRAKVGFWTFGQARKGRSWVRARRPGGALAETSRNSDQSRDRPVPFLVAQSIFLFAYSLSTHGFSVLSLASSLITRACIVSLPKAYDGRIR